MRQIKVLVVEDSFVFRQLLVQALSSDPMINVVAAVKDPYEARDAIMEFNPDVMTLDIELPKMNGLVFLQKLMPQHPLPVIVISTLSEKVFDALNAGAVDFVAKPVGATREQVEDFIKRELIVKIKVASVAKVGNRKKEIIEMPGERRTRAKDDTIIAIGSSTGGPEALSSLIKEFGTDIPGCVVVQHMPEKFTKMFADRLNNVCAVTVKEAKNGDPVLPGQVLIAPGGLSHLHLIKGESGYQVVLRPGPKVNGISPSVDIFFESVAKVAKDQAIGIILTGMGGDGAKGLLDMRNAGARTIGQDESTCVVYGMPRVAYEMGAVEYQEKLPDIAKKMYSLLNKM